LISLLDASTVQLVAIYTFRCACGKTEKDSFTRGRIPPLGEKLEGETCPHCEGPLTRVLSSGVSGRVSVTEFKVHQFRNLKGCENDADGKPIIRSQRHLKSVLAANDLRLE
jgi:hypothetical protein